MITDEDAATMAASSELKEFPKHHPAGLWVLFTTEMWERFCYYGMRAFLVLYLVSKSTADNPGLGWTEKDAYGLYGIFTGLVYLMPLLGGWVADRFIGPHRSMFWGGVVMAIGEFTLASTEFCRQGAGIPVNFRDDPLGMLAFYVGLSLMIVGTGFFKPCISVMVGQLYSKDDPRRDGAFTIFYMGINLGAMLAPLIAGTIAEKIGYSYGFMTAGVGMIFGLITYSCLRPFYLSNIGLAPMRADDNTAKTEKQKEALRVAEYERTRPLTRVDYDRMFVIGILVFFTIAFWTAFEQAGSTLNLFAKKETDRRVPSAVTRLIPESISPMLPNEFSKDLKEAINEMEQIHVNVADLLQKTSEQRKKEKEKKLEQAKEKQKERQAKINEKGYFKVVFEEFNQKDKFLFDQEGKEIPIDSLVKELLDSADKLVVKERIEFSGQPIVESNDSTNSGVLEQSPIKSVPRSETLELYDKIASRIPAETALPNRKPETPDEFKVEPNSISQHVLYLAGYKLDKDDFE
ncbi:MAG: peptide MFS transporter, partial [Thermoguttaceae bacterium]